MGKLRFIVTSKVPKCAEEMSAFDEVFNCLIEG